MSYFLAVEDICEMCYYRKFFFASIETITKICYDGIIAINNDIPLTLSTVTIIVLCGNNKNYCINIAKKSTS